LALAVGKAYALKASGANAPWGRGYSKAFCEWMARYGFGAMHKGTRTYAILLYENLADITAWRTERLTEAQRKRLAGPQQNVKRWRRETNQPPPRPCTDELVRQTKVVLRKFTSLPARDKQQVLDHAAIVLSV
jgi:hypothetical protein